MTKNDFIRTVTDNYRDVPGDAEVVVRWVDGILRPAYVTELVDGNSSKLLIGASPE